MIVAFLMFTAQAATVPAPHATPVPPAQADRKVCRSEATTGSIMPPKRVCHLRSEWAAIDAANGQASDAFRNRAQRGVSGGGFN